jgi:two-component system chemotaxis response regulator CheB
VRSSLELFTVTWAAVFAGRDRRMRSREPGGRLGVLAIADSPVVRQLVAGVFAKETDVSLVTAFDWRHAGERLRAGPPDVVLLCSERLWPDDEGARAIYEQRIPLVADRIDVRASNVQAALLGLVARVREAARPPRRTAPAPPQPGRDIEFPATPPIVAIGASAGGTMALKSILPALPARAPAIAIVQHMSAHFTATFAHGLERISSIEVREGEDGDALVPGRALIAPGDRHMAIERRGDGYCIALLKGPPVGRHRPSVNVLFRSAAQHAGPNAVGVVLTGMGDDGADGLFEMKELGARTIAQNEATSVVFGMPRAAIVRGGVQDVVPLRDIPAAILKAAHTRAAR